MKFASLTRHLGMAIAAFVVVTACGSTSGGGTASCKPSTATSVADCGGLDALVTAAKAEGKLNIIATPPDWANYGASINAFSAKYNIKITSANPNGSSQEEVDAVKNLAGTSSAPDVLDVGLSVALANTALVAARVQLTGRREHGRRARPPADGGRLLRAGRRDGGHGQGWPDPGGFGVGPALQHAWKGCFRLEDLRTFRRAPRLLLRPGHQQG